MKNNKSPSEDGVAVEAMKLAGTKLLRAIVGPFIQWPNAEIILLHKKWNITNLKYYRPISLLSKIHKLFCSDKKKIN